MSRCSRASIHAIRTAANSHQIRHQSGSQRLADDLVVDHSFSSKPVVGRAYNDYYEKMNAYVAILVGPARAIDPDMSAQTFRRLRPTKMTLCSTTSIRRQAEPGSAWRTRSWRWAGADGAAEACQWWRSPHPPERSAISPRSHQREQPCPGTRWIIVRRRLQTVGAAPR